MRRINLFLCLIFETVLECAVALPFSQRINITHDKWEGMGLIIAVDRQAVQEKLDDFHNIEVNCQKAPKLYMPTTPVFSDRLTTDQHVIYVDVGALYTLEFGGEPSISSHGPEVSISIPFLADCPDGDPKYALALDNIYQKDGGAVSNPNIAFSSMGIDKISLNDTGVVCKNGSDELRANFVKSNPCKTPSNGRRHLFESLNYETLYFSFSEPDLDFCDDRHSLADHQACNNLEEIRSGVEKAGPNVCKFFRSPWEKNCETTLDTISITEGFRDLLLLKEDDPIIVVSSEDLYGDFVVGLQYPCIL